MNRQNQWWPLLFHISRSRLCFTQKQCIEKSFWMVLKMFNFFLKILASRSYASIRLKLYSIYRWYFHLFAYEFFGYFSTFLFFTRFWCFFLCLSRGLKFRLWMKCLRCETTIELLNSHHSLFTTFFFIHHFMIYTDIQWKFFIKYSVWFKLMMFLFQHSSWCYESPYSSSPFR